MCSSRLRKKEEDVMINRRWFLGAALGAPALAAGLAHAQEAYPAKSVQLVIPFAAGGPTDLLGRLVAQNLSEAWGKPVVADNRPGASGSLGSEIVARAAPDGYTLVLGNSASHSAYQLLNPKSATYDGLKDFTPIALVATEPLILMARVDLGFKNINDIIAFAKANPGKLSFATAAVGSSAHLAFEAFLQSQGLEMLNVPFTGAGPASQAVLSGAVDLNMVGVSNMTAMVGSGKAVAIGVLAPERLKGAPDVPTIREQGVDLVFGSWYGVFGPAGLPDAIADRIHGDINRTFGTEAAAEKLNNLGFELLLRSRPEFTTYVEEYRERIARVIADSGMQVEN